MNNVKKNKNRIIKAVLVIAVIAAAAVLIWNIFMSRWRISSDEPASVALRFTLSGGYNDITITDREEISHIMDMVSDMQDNIRLSNISAVRESEKFQKDPQISLTLVYDNMRQEILIHKNNVIIFDRWDGVNYDDMYFLELEDMQTGELTEGLYSYIDDEN